MTNIACMHVIKSNQTACRMVCDGMASYRIGYNCLEQRLYSGCRHEDLPLRRYHQYKHATSSILAPLHELWVIIVCDGSLTNKGRKVNCHITNISNEVQSKTKRKNASSFHSCSQFASISHTRWVLSMNSLPLIVCLLPCVWYLHCSAHLKFSIYSLTLSQKACLEKWRKQKTRPSISVFTPP